MLSDEMADKTAGEMVELMRDKVQKLVDAEGTEISADDAIRMLTEAILIGATVIAAVREESISIVLGSMAGIALEAELSNEIDAAMARANIAKFN